MKSSITTSADIEILVSDTFLEIHSINLTGRFYFHNIKRISISGQTNYLITALSWIFEILFHADGADRYKDDYLEIITNDNKTAKWLLTEKEKSRVKNVVKEIQKNLKK